MQLTLYPRVNCFISTTNNAQYELPVHTETKGVQSQVNSWQYTSQLMAVHKSTHGSTQVNSWQYTRQLMAVHKSTHGSTQDNSWQYTRSQ